MERSSKRLSRKNKRSDQALGIAGDSKGKSERRETQRNGYEYREGADPGNRRVFGWRGDTDDGNIIPLRVAWYVAYKSLGLITSQQVEGPLKAVALQAVYTCQSSPLVCAALLVYTQKLSAYRDEGGLRR